MNTVLEVIGWIGSGLIVLSLTQARVWRFRWMNLTGSIIATAYNTILGIWPFAAMNAAIAIINVYWLVRLHRERHDDAVYRVIRLDPDDGFLQHVLAVHSDDIAKHAPDFSPAPQPGRATFLVVRGDEAVGVVAIDAEGDGVGRIDLDWVKPRFRDFTPGEFVYRQSSALAAAGFRRVELVPHDATDREYLRHVGFHKERSRWVRDVAA